MEEIFADYLLILNHFFCNVDLDTTSITVIDKKEFFFDDKDESALFAFVDSRNKKGRSSRGKKNKVDFQIRGAKL